MVRVTSLPSLWSAFLQPSVGIRHNIKGALMPAGFFRSTAISPKRSIPNWSSSPNLSTMWAIRLIPSLGPFSLFFNDGIDDAVLLPPCGKSNIFTCGLDRSIKALLVGTLGFNEGSLPIKYLGVPLISTKLKKVYCNALVDRLTSRIRSWPCKFLSYAGRIQLVSSVLFAIQVFWTSNWILPKGVQKKIEKVLCSFLFQGDDVRKGGAKVAWGSLCLPKKEGGLWFKGVDAWNRAAMTKHIWHILSDQDQSILTSWVRFYYSRYLVYQAPLDCSWTWRKILNWRSRVLDNFYLNDGRVTWFMSPNGATKSAWDFFRDKGAPVPWHQIVVFSAMLPRHAMILWLLARGRLNTLDRLTSFAISQSLTCPLCKGDNENLSYLLFSCSNRIWHSLFGKSNLPSSSSCWEDLFLDVAHRLKGKSLVTLSWNSSWLQASISFGKKGTRDMGKWRDLTNVYLDIVLDVRLRVHSLSFDSANADSRWISPWGLYNDAVLVLTLVLVLARVVVLLVLGFGLPQN